MNVFNNKAVEALFHIIKESYPELKNTLIECIEKSHKCVLQSFLTLSIQTNNHIIAIPANQNKFLIKINNDKISIILILNFYNNAMYIESYLIEKISDSKEYNKKKSTISYEVHDVLKNEYQINILIEYIRKKTSKKHQLFLTLYESEITSFVVTEARHFKEKALKKIERHKCSAVIEIVLSLFNEHYIVKEEQLNECLLKYDISLNKIELNKIKDMFH